MTIAVILEGKGREVFSVDSATSVREAVALLSERRIGALPVIEGGRVAGIISERDIIQCLTKEGAAMLDWAVARLMSAPAITVDSRTSVLAALSQMTKRRIRHLPVVESEQLVGIVSIGDLVAHRLARIEQEAEAMRAYIQSA